MTTKRLPLRDAIARLERRDPVLPALLSLEAISHPESEPEPRPATGSPDRRTVSVDVRVDRDVFVRYRTLQHELRQDGHEEPTLRSIVSALLERLPSDPGDVHHRVTTWRASDPASQRPSAERDLHRLRVDVPTVLVRRVEAMLFRLQVEGRALALTDVIRACLAHGPRCSGELTALLADSDGCRSEHSARAHYASAGKHALGARSAGCRGAADGRDRRPGRGRAGHRRVAWSARGHDPLVISRRRRRESAS